MTIYRPNWALVAKNSLPKYVMLQSGHWYVRRFFKGSDGRKVVIKRRCDPETPEQAKFLAQQIALVVHRPEPQHESLNDFLDRYLLAKKQNVSQRVYEATEAYFERHVRKNIGHLKMPEIKPKHIQSLYAQINRTPSVIHKLHKYLSAAFNQGIKWEDLERNPCKGVLLPKAPKPDIQVFDAQNAKRFIALCRETDKNICLEFALETGMRPQEYLALKWADLTAHGVKVRRAVVFGLKGGGFTFKEPKTQGSRRTVPLSPQMIERLEVHRLAQKKWIADLKRSIRHSTGYRAKQARKSAREILKNIGEHDLIFPADTGGPRHPKSFDRWQFKPMVAKLGLTGSSYTLRHTSITLLLAAGVDVKTIAEKHGTSPQMIWDTYGHVLESMRTKATKKISEMLYE